MSSAFEIKVNDNRTVFTLEQMKKRIQKRTAMVREMTMFAEAETRRNIVAEVDPDGNAFAPLAESTLRRKKTRAILRETSAMIASIQSSASGDTGRVQIGTDYAIYHKTGTSKMPQRNPIGIGDKLREQLNQIARRHLGL